MTTTTTSSNILRCTPEAEVIRAALAREARRRGAAKGRATQAANRAAKAAEAEAAKTAVAREAAKAAVRAAQAAVAAVKAAKAVVAIDREIDDADLRVANLRPSANDPRGGRRAQEAAREIARAIARKKELFAEREHFAAKM